MISQPELWKEKQEQLLSSGTKVYGSILPAIVLSTWDQKRELSILIAIIHNKNQK